jgi:MFS superfamily sulfate permease-like transporter
MKETLKRRIILFLIPSIVVVGIFDVAYGVLFGVFTNVLINAFWNSKLFPEKKKKERELIVESVQPPKFSSKPEWWNG